MCEVNLDFELSFDDFEKEFDNALYISFPKLGKCLMKFFNIDAEEGLVATGVHLAVEEGHLLDDLFDLVIELLDVGALDR